MDEYSEDTVVIKTDSILGLALSDKDWLMLIGERLRQLRESKNPSQGDIENGPVCFVAMSRGWRTVTRFRQWRL